MVIVFASVPRAFEPHEGQAVGRIMGSLLSMGGRISEPYSSDEGSTPHAAPPTMVAGL
jgi:hypothetical protein